MKKKIIIYAISIVILITAGLYAAFLYILPAVLNSSITELENLFNEKTDMQLSVKSFKIKTTPRLLLILKSDNVSITNNDTKMLEMADLNGKIDLKHFSSSKIHTGAIKVYGDNLPQSSGEKKSQKSFDFNNLPELDIESIEYISENLQAKVNGLKLEQGKLTLDAFMKTPFLQHTVKAKGLLEIGRNNVAAENFKITLGNADVNIKGNLYDKHEGLNLNVYGDNLPVNDIEKSLLYYQKSQDPAKKFIENFQNYTGNIDLALNITQKGMFGTATAKNLRASTVLFDIPFYFKEVVMYFDGKTITSKAEGILGGEKVLHELEILNLGTPDKEVTGIVTANLTDKFKYIPDLTIKNSVDAKVIYNIKNQKIDVKYYLTVPQEADLFYQNAYLGLRDKNRRFFFQTYKDGNNMYIKHYDYSLVDDETVKNIVLGEGLLIKENGHMVPQYITCKTNGFAPASVTGSFGKYIAGGEFNGDLKYDFINSKILGNFELINTNFKDFRVKSAKIIAEKAFLNIKAEGTYMKEKFTGDIKAKNKFDDNIVVQKMDLFLDRLIITQRKNVEKHPVNMKNIDDIETKVRDADITIENWDIKLNEIIKDRLKLENIELLGSLKDNVFKFTMNELEFSDGILKAAGDYDFERSAASIDFTARDINSNTVADILFNLPNQVEGIADAKLSVKTIGKLDDIKGKGDFSIEEGFLPKLGSTEFMIKKRKKFQIADLVNVDLTRKEAFKSNIKGNFTLDNTKLENIKLTSQQKYLSLFISGDYELQEQYGCLNLFGKYNKQAPKGVKIVIIPLDWILKVVFRPEKSRELYRTSIEQIPDIDAAKENEKLFRVKVQGDLNEDNIKVEIKGIE